MNIRNEADRSKIEAQGYKWVVVTPRGESKGRVISRHKTYEAAGVAAKGFDRAIVSVA